MPSKNIKTTFHLLVLTLIITTLSAPVSAQLLGGANWSEKQVGEGVTWRYFNFGSLFNSNQSVSYMEVDLANPNVGLTINYREGTTQQNPPVWPRARTSVLANEVPNAVAALNGAFFNTNTYNPSNPNAVWGGGTSYLKSDNTTVHTFDGANNINRFGGGLVFNSTNDVDVLRRPGSGWGSINASWGNMMVNGPMLVENGVLETYSSGNTHATARHPRSAVGVTANNKLILLAVDGRTPQAAGMSLSELGQVIKELGAVDAVSLDGGGSTTLWAAGEPNNGVVNYPSDNGVYDHGGERSCANVIVVTSSQPSSGGNPAIVIDNSSSGFSASSNWSTSTWVPGFYGANYRARLTASTSDAASWSGNISVAGNYEVFARWVAGSTRATSAPYIVHHTGGTTTVTVDQTQNNGQWVSLGTFNLASGNSLRVQLSCWTSSGDYVIADAVGFSPQEVIVDNTDSGFTASSNWFPSTSVAGYYGTNYHARATASTSDAATWKANLGATGSYKVYARWTTGGNRATSAPFIVYHTGGSTTVVKNQQANGGSWQLLGTFNLAAGNSTRVALSCWTSSGAFVIGDAIRIVPN